MAYRQMFEIEIKHGGLNKYKVIRGSDPHVVEQKARAQKKQWEEMWEKKQETERKKAERERAAEEKEAKKEFAAQQTSEAEEKLKNIENTLLFTLDVDDEIDWNTLKDTTEFNKEKPAYTEMPVPEKPEKTNKTYQPDLTIIDKLIPPLKEKKIKVFNESFHRDLKQWEEESAKIIKENEDSQKEYEVLLAEWEEEKARYLEQQKKTNDAIDQQHTNYLNGFSTAIIDYCDMVLSRSVYPDEFPQEYDIDYNPDTKILIVEYSLPSPNQMPSLKEVKYIQSRDEFKHTHLSVSMANKMYDNLLYQMTLRTLHELYEADTVNAINSIIFNGWVNSVDKATGQEVNGCILSIQTTKEEFMDINLAQVDPKLCFKNLKGIGSSKLHSLSPIAPIFKIDREDPRFVSSYPMADSLQETENLASMDWQDFEHLIRELFEKEFNQSDGEVKITKASKDGGLDAVAFDPDPLRGGKVAIQAKRYTNVVGVSAVRDLYGTVLNEGANKGILVSTADYGPDAYDFAKGKPLTLLNGNNLLHLLQKHGHKAMIDLKEAKAQLAEKEKS